MEDVQVQVCVFAFDLLYFARQPLIGMPLRKRRQMLHENFLQSDHFRFAQYRDASGVDEVQAFLEEAMTAGCEGLMVKTLDTEATYEPSKRSRHWLKLKKDYLQGIGDSLDLVPIGAYLGKGKRTGTFGGFLLACYSPESEEFQSICKIGTGFSEEDLSTLSSYYYSSTRKDDGESDRMGKDEDDIVDEEKTRILKEPHPFYRFGDGVKPDVWLEASQVLFFIIFIGLGGEGC